MLTLERAAERLGVSATCVRHMIERKVIPATQAVDCAPWEIPATALEHQDVKETVRRAKARSSRRLSGGDDQQVLFNRS